MRLAPWSSGLHDGALPFRVNDDVVAVCAPVEPGGLTLMVCVDAYLRQNVRKRALKRRVLRAYVRRPVPSEVCQSHFHGCPQGPCEFVDRFPIAASVAM
jgi:hypothetical protein